MPTNFSYIVNLQCFRFIQHSPTYYTKKTNHIDFQEVLRLKGVGDEREKQYKLYGVVVSYPDILDNFNSSYQYFMMIQTSKGWAKAEHYSQPSTVKLSLLLVFLKCFTPAPNMNYPLPSQV